MYCSPTRAIAVNGFHVIEKQKQKQKLKSSRTRCRASAAGEPQPEDAMVEMESEVDMPNAGRLGMRELFAALPLPPPFPPPSDTQYAASKDGRGIAVFESESADPAATTDS